jgi:arylsulfatase A-like enzyme
MRVIHPASLAAICAALVAPLLAGQPPSEPSRHLIVVVDGLRPDYVTPDVMPNLTALGRRGVVFERHHAVFPSVTRVNAASISTGSYPDRHGLLGNSVFFPRVDPSRFLDTADREHLARIAAAEARLLTAPTMGEILQAAGRRMLAISSGSAGSAILNNHSIAGGAVLHAQFAMPETMRAHVAAAGPPPSSDSPPGARDRYAVDLFLHVGIPRVDPTVTVLWLGELDATAHDKGIGAPETQAVLRRVDGEIQRVQDGLRAAGLFDHYNIWVTSDHGFSSHTGAPDVNGILGRLGHTLPDGSPAIVQGSGAIYVRDGHDSLVPTIVRALQNSKGIGAIFTPAAKPGSLDGGQPGTLSFEAVHWAHSRSAAILFSPDWSDDANAHGVRGSTASSGTAGHGSSSRWDIHNTLIAAGPDVRRGMRIDVPSANVDFAPTILNLLRLTTPLSMQGRPLNEALVRGAPLGANAVRSLSHTAATRDGSYVVEALFTMVSAGGAEYRYFDGTRTVRKSQ